MLRQSIITLAGLIPGLGLLLLRRWLDGLLVAFFTMALLSAYLLDIDAYFYAEVYQPLRLGLATALWLGQFILTARLAQPVENEEPDGEIEPDPFAEYLAGGEIPPDYYLPETALLRGWPGHRNRPHRLGLDPLETDFEWAHMQGLFLQHLLRAKLVSREPVYQLLIALLGVFCLAPTLFALWLAVTQFAEYFLVALVFTPLSLAGASLFVGLRKSRLLMQSEERLDEDEDTEIPH